MSLPAARHGASPLEMLRESDPVLSQVIGQVERAKLAPPMREQVQNWIPYLRISRNLSPYTVAAYTRGVLDFLRWLSGVKEFTVETLGSVGPQQVDRWMQHLYVANHERARTRGGKLTAVRRFYAWREAYGFPGNPARDIQGPKKERPIPKKYTEQQLIKIFSACDLSKPLGVRDYSLLLFMYTTGARRIEVEALRLDQLELATRGGNVRFHGKGAKERMVHFGSTTLVTLKAWLAERDRLKQIHDEQAVWLSVGNMSSGRRLSRSATYEVIRRAIRRAGLRISGRQGLHRLRVTFATDLYDENMDIERIAVIMGHDDIQTTRGYIAVSEKQLKTRMPEQRVRKVTGKQGPLPLWLRRKMEEEGLATE